MKTLIVFVAIIAICLAEAPAQDPAVEETKDVDSSPKTKRGIYGGLYGYPSLYDGWHGYGGYGYHAPYYSKPIISSYHHAPIIAKSYVLPSYHYPSYKSYYGYHGGWW